MTNWGSLKKYVTGDVVTTQVGLFNVDMTQFRADCAAFVGCYNSHYNDFDGSAVGVLWTPASAAGTNFYGVAFAKSMHWANIYVTGTAIN